MDDKDKQALKDIAKAVIKISRVVAPTGDDRLLICNAKKIDLQHEISAISDKLKQYINDA